MASVNISALNQYVNRVVQPYLMLKAKEIAEEAKRAAPVGATGDLKDSIIVERNAKGGATVKATAPYAGYVHQGTGPGHTPNPRPPYFPKLRRSGLILWSESKRLNPYQVAHGIAEKGTPANPFLEVSISKILGKYQFRWIRRDLNI